MSENKARTRDSGAHIPVSDHARMCACCRRYKPRAELIRITADHATGEVKVHADRSNGSPRQVLHGRSAYLCATEECVNRVLKGTRLKMALEGRKGKNLANQRTVKWPLEPQLIQEILSRCSDASKTCQNTER